MKSSTSVPFPCLDCVAEMEATLIRQRQDAQARDQLRAFIAGQPGKASVGSSQAAKKEDSECSSDAGLGIVLQPTWVSKSIQTMARPSESRRLLSKKSAWTLR